jgi:hypothetical protein
MSGKDETGDTAGEHGQPIHHSAFEVPGMLAKQAVAVRHEAFRSFVEFKLTRVPKERSARARTPSSDSGSFGVLSAKPADPHSIERDG